MKKKCTLSRAPKTCSTCNEPFLGTFNQIYCSKNCSTYRQTYPGLSRGTAGAISELIVCADLLKKGYEVFRAVSQSCSCDLLISKNGVIKRLEVRTASGKEENPSFPIHPRDRGKQDHFAAVLNEKPIYIPPLES